jgi:hypothetical protein
VCHRLDRPHNKLLLGQSQGVSLIQIISQTEESTTILTPCNSTLAEELGHTYTIKDPFELKCEDPVNFNYTNLIEVWKNDHCCSYSDADSGWGDDNVNTIDRIQKGKNFKRKGWYCGCYNWCRARYRCLRHTIAMRKCNYYPTLW